MEKKSLKIERHIEGLCAIVAPLKVAFAVDKA